MKIIKKNIIKFFTGLLVPLLILGTFLAFSALLLEKSGEYFSIEKIVEKQKKTNGIFGSALYSRAFYYKQELFRQVKPQITTVGSSRVLQFRQEDFSQPFVNIGSMRNIGEVDQISRAVFSNYQPLVVILGVDFWWFNDNHTEAETPITPETIHPTIYDLLQPAKWIASGKLTGQDTLAILREETPNIGIAAIARKDGFDVHGSYHYNSTLTGAVPSEDPQFAACLKKIKSGDKMYAYGEKISEPAWEKFGSLLTFLNEKKIHVIMLLPPLAPPVIDAMAETGKYAYIDDLRQKLALASYRFNFPLYDMHDMRAEGVTSCEFIDGHHGGSVIYKRILLNMAVNDEALRPFVKLPEIGWDIDRFKGQASTMMEKETDFLGIGCEKGKKTEPVEYP